MRPARTSPPVREILLETLADFRWPQNAGSSRSTCWPSTSCNWIAARSLPCAGTNGGLGPGTGARDAYIAPALKPDGSPNPRWITRSDWDMTAGSWCRSGRNAC